LSQSSSLSSTATTIVNTILDQQLKTVYRILSSDRIGPKASALALLTQVASMPKSSAADMLYRLVVSGFNVWPKLLAQKGSMREKEIVQAAKMRKLDKRESQRTHAVYLLLALLKHGSITTKESLLGNRLLMAPLIKFIPLDPNSLVLAILDTLTNHILSNVKIPRPAKTAFFNTEQFLSKISGLHSRESNYSHDSLNVLESIERFLLDACTTPGNGICFEDKGWYPRSDSFSTDTDSQIHNVILLRFIIQLRPLEIPFHRTLALRILEKCAELRAPYLSSLKNPIEPKLSFLFISVNSFWQDIISLPLPKQLSDGTDLPDEPPTAVTLSENLLPTFITKQYLSTALTNNSALVRLTSSQLLIAILGKLRDVQRMVSSGGERWLESFDIVLEKIARRLPDSGLIVTLYSKSSGNRLLSISSVKLLSLYSELLSAADSIRKIDAKALINALHSDWSFSEPMDILEHIHIIHMIEEQTELTWWTKIGTRLYRLG
jgi:nucleolar pre-ribosomal-associated protein 1